MSVKKKKKEPKTVTSNLNMFINKEFHSYPQSRVKNILKALETQLEPSEHEKLNELYEQMHAEDSNAYQTADDVSSENFTVYVKKLIHKYAAKDENKHGLAAG